APTASTSTTAPIATTSTTNRPAPTTTAAVTTTVAPTTTAAPKPFVLRGNGVGVADFGDDETTSVAAITAAIGPPDEDSGYTGPGYYQFRTRLVRWKNLSVEFAERNGGHELAGWRFDNLHDLGSFPLQNGLTVNMSAEDYQRTAPQPLVKKD